MLDFRGLVATLETRGELRRVSKRVDARYELAALMAELDRERKAFIFENVAGAKFPLVGGLLNRWECYGWALGTRPGEPFTAADLAARLEATQARSMPPRVVQDGPVKERVLRDEAINLADLPAPTAFEFDSGAFITAACGISRNPHTGQLNVGIYRTQVLGRDTMTVSANASSDLHLFYDYAEQHGQSMPIALAIGVEPALMMAAVCKLPTDRSELDLAGALQGKPIDLVKCETSDLLVPANAEIVIEGRVDCSRKVVNTLGEFVGQYGTDIAPVAQVTAITHRRDAMYYAILAGRNPEHNTLGSVAGLSFRRALEHALRQQLPHVKDLHVYLSPALGAMMHVVIAISKKNDAEPMALINAAFKAPLTIAGIEMPVERITKRIIVVDDDINVHDLEDVEWAQWNRAAAADKVRVLPDVASWNLERCAKPGRGSFRLAVDATSDMVDRDALRRTRIPGAETIRLADYQ